MHYIKQKRSQIDNCNICGRFTKLTWDHIPPKSVKIGDCAYADTLFAEKDMPSKDRHMKRYQNGVKYRTICQKCNGELLSKYDKVYAEFVGRVHDTIDIMTQEVLDGEKSYDLSSVIGIDVQINKILRCVLGHFMAMKVLSGKCVTTWRSSTISRNATTRLWHIWTPF